MNSGAPTSQRSTCLVAVLATSTIVWCCGSTSKAIGLTWRRASLSVNESRLLRPWTSTTSNFSWLALWT